MDVDKTKMTSNNQEKASVAISCFFTSVFMKGDKEELHEINGRPDIPTVETLSISPEIVAEKLKKLNISKSPGPDQLNPRI